VWVDGPLDAISSVLGASRVEGLEIVGRNRDHRVQIRRYAHLRAPRSVGSSDDMGSEQRKRRPVILILREGAWQGQQRVPGSTYWSLILRSSGGSGRAPPPPTTPCTNQRRSRLPPVGLAERSPSFIQEDGTFREWTFPEMLQIPVR
jgi:hypothetical protein